MIAKQFRIRSHTRCRICKSGGLRSLYSLGSISVSGYINEGEKEIRAPLEMVMCPSCRLVQLRHTAPQEILYKRYYWYRSGVTQSMREALRDITSQIEQLIPLAPDDVVLDIGSNDGTLLRSYGVTGILKVGVEPAENLAEEGSRGVDVFIGDFWNAETYKTRVNRRAKVVTAIGMFYDLEDPNAFIADIARCLAPDGVFVAQLMCLKNMIDNNDVGNICHEHLEYYSLQTLQTLYANHALEIVDIEYNTVNGGSYRIFARPSGGTFTPRRGARTRVQRFFRNEKHLSLKKTHMDFYRRIQRLKRECVSFIKKEVSAGKSVWVYGASTKGNTILQYFGLDTALIRGASEKSPDKWGKMTVGSHIPIYSEAEARANKPDFYLILPYAFVEEFRKRENDFLKRGGKFIVPLPEFRVIP